MKLVQFTHIENPDIIRVGYVHGDKVIDINKVRCECKLPKTAKTMVKLIKRDFLEDLKLLRSRNPQWYSLDSVRLETPITGQDKVLCICDNYYRKGQTIISKVPIITSKFNSSVIGPNDSVKIRTDVTNSVDYGIVFCAIIGKEASNVATEDASKYVFGYTIAQDITARDWKRKNGGQLLLSKSMDTFCPIGPWIVTPDEIGNPFDLKITCSVNGELRQKSSTSQLINNVPDIIARLSSVMTLYPGDIILTGTPEGAGMDRDPPRYLKPGDIITSEIENIGVLTTKVENISVSL